MIKEYQEIQCDCCGKIYKRMKEATTNTKDVILYIADNDFTGASYELCSFDCMVNFLKENFNQDSCYKIYTHTIYI